MGSKIILVADSDVYYRTLIAASLQMITGISDILKAATLDAAIGIIKRHRPDIVFLSTDLLQTCPLCYTEVLRKQKIDGCLIIMTEEGDDHYRDTKIESPEDIFFPKDKLLRPIKRTADTILWILADRLASARSLRTPAYDSTLHTL